MRYSPGGKASFGGDGLSGSLPRKDLREPQGALQIPPLRSCGAPVGMTRGTGGSGWSGYGMGRNSKWFRYTLSKNISKKGPQISPLRCAPVEMTKGRAVPPSTVVVEQEPFFITLGGPKAHDSSVEKHFQERAAEPQVPPLRCAPVGMTRGEGWLRLEWLRDGRNSRWFRYAPPRAHYDPLSQCFDRKERLWF